MYDVYSCGFDGVIVRPKRAHKQEIHIFASDFEGSRGHELSRESLQASEPGHFWVTLGSIWARFMIALGFLLAYAGDFGSILRSFRAHFAHIDVEWQV